MLRSLERLLAALSGAAAARPRAALLLVLALTLALGAGLPRLQFETALFDWLPTRNPDVAAFREVVARIDGITNQELVWLELDPEKATAAGVQQVTDEAAIRAQIELAAFVTEQVPEIRFTFGLPYWLQLADVAAGGSGDVTALEPLRLRLLWQAVWRTQQDLLSALLSDDGRAALLGFVIEGDPVSEDARAVGRKLLTALAAYRAWDGKTFDLFRDDLLAPVGLASGMARLDAHVQGELLRLMPLAALLLLGLLALAFGDLRLVLVAAACPLLALGWTLGLMGWLGVSVNIVNLALLPLMLGSGIDYAIHLLGAYQGSGVEPERSVGQETRAHAPTGSLAARLARRTGVPLTLTALTSLAGLLALALSGVPGMVSLGLLTALSLIILLLLVLTLPFAALSALHYRPPTRPSPAAAVMDRLLATLAARSRLVGALVLLAAILALTQFGRAPVQLDVILGNFPPQDPLARAVSTMQGGAATAFPEFVIFSGDVANPELLTFQQELGRRLRDPETGLGPQTRVLDLSKLLGSYVVLADGPGQAVARFVAAGGELEQLAPTDEEGIRSTLAAMHASATWAPLARLLTSRDLDLSVMIVLPATTAVTRAGVAELTSAFRRALAGGGAPPHGQQLHFLGYRTISDLFVRTSVRWMWRLFVVTLLAATLLVGLFARSRRRRRTVAAVALAMALAGLWWQALVAVAGVPISVFLLFPVVFLVGLGSDYAIHLAWAADTPSSAPSSAPASAPSSRGTTGKAVLYSALTTAAVFAAFAGAYLNSIREMMLATALAAAAAFAAALLLIPLLLYAERERAATSEPPATTPR